MMTVDSPLPILLAVDLGLRSGLAQYGGDGRLLGYRSTHFGSLQRLKKGIPGIFRSMRSVRYVVAEGDRNLGELWQKHASKQGAEFRFVSPEKWRGELLLARDQKNRRIAKDTADILARKVITWSGLKRPTSLRHDAAEAILIGLWATLELGWLPSNPLTEFSPN